MNNQKDPVDALLSELAASDRRKNRVIAVSLATQLAEHLDLEDIDRVFDISDSILEYINEEHEVEFVPDFDMNPTEKPKEKPSLHDMLGKKDTPKDEE